MSTPNYVRTGYLHMTLGVVIHLILVRLSRPSIPFSLINKHIDDGKHLSIRAMDL